MLPLQPANEEANDNVDRVLEKESEEDQLHNVGLMVDAESSEECLIFDEGYHYRSKNGQIDDVKDDHPAQVPLLPMTKFVCHYRQDFLVVVCVVLQELL